jgi:hypothetical protein
MLRELLTLTAWNARRAVKEVDTLSHAGSQEPDAIGPDPKQLAITQFFKKQKQ